MPITDEEFEYWLADMDDALDRFFSTLPPELKSKLDYSLESLDALEAWTLARYQRIDDIREPSQSKMLDGLQRYVGETYRKQLGGRWELRLDNPKYVYHGLPQITGYSPRPTPEAPIILVTAAIDRRKGSYWNDTLAAMKKRAGK